MLSFCPVCPVCAHTHGNNFTSFYTTSDAPIQSSLLWQTLARSLAHLSVHLYRQYIGTCIRLTSHDAHRRNTSYTHIHVVGKVYMYMHSDNVLLVLLLYLSHICIIIHSHETSIHGGLVQVTDRTGTALQGLSTRPCDGGAPGLACITPERRVVDVSGLSPSLGWARPRFTVCHGCCSKARVARHSVAGRCYVTAPYLTCMYVPPTLFLPAWASRLPAWGLLILPLPIASHDCGPGGMFACHSFISRVWAPFL